MIRSDCNNVAPFIGLFGVEQTKKLTRRARGNVAEGVAVDNNCRAAVGREIMTCNGEETTGPAAGVVDGKNRRARVQDQYSGGLGYEHKRSVDRAAVGKTVPLTTPGREGHDDPQLVAVWPEHFAIGDDGVAILGGNPAARWLRRQENGVSRRG